MRTLAVTLVIALFAGCASRGVQRRDHEALLRADALVLEGCYRCLIGARDLYAEALTHRRTTRLLQRLFEVELLMALREKELALDSAPTFVSLRARAAILPSAFMAEQYLQLAEALPPDEIGTSRQERRKVLADWRSRTDRLDEELAWLRASPISAPVRQYLSIALECAYKEARLAPAAGVAPVSASSIGVPPLLAYRAAICFPLDAEGLERLQTRVPGFREAAFFRGRVALQGIQKDGGRKALGLLRSAYDAFPRSAGVTYLNGSLTQLTGDFRAALRFYDETLALQPLHEDAMLGRAVCLTYLKRSDEAIDAATRLIDRSADNQGEALYWRAWNHHQRAELGAARADIDRAKTLRYSAPVLTLAGMIEYDQEDLSPAGTDLSAAKSLDEGNCVARWYLALVGLKRTAWAPAATEFAGAMRCYAASASETERKMRQMAAREDLGRDWQAAQLAGFETAIREDRSQESASAYNAAINFLRSGDRANAVAYADLAARDPARVEKVEELRKLLARVREPR